MNKEQIRAFIKDSFKDVLAPHLFKGLIERQLDTVITAMDVFLFDSPGPYDTRSNSPGRFNFVKMSRGVLGPVGVAKMEEARNALSILLMNMRANDLATWSEFSNAKRKGDK